MDKKAVIFYFSQSGNSLYVAKKLAESMGDTIVVSIPEAVYSHQYKYTEYEKVGFVIPLYFMGMPRLVQEFVSKLEISKNCYAFSIITRAITKGRILQDMDILLGKKEVKMRYGKYLTFPDSYIKWAEGPSKESLIKKFEQSERTLRVIIEQVVREEQYRDKEGAILKLASAVVYSVWKGRLKGVSKKFKVSNSCTSCGICEKTCPSRNIKLESGKPLWSDQCEDCMACVQHCPKKAIYFNRNTIHKRRYIHPNIKVEELLYKR